MITVDVPARPFHTTALADEPPAFVRQLPPAAAKPYDAVGDFLTIGRCTIHDDAAHAALKKLDRELLAARNLISALRDLMPDDGSAADLSARIAAFEANHGGLPAAFPRAA